VTTIEVEDAMRMAEALVKTLTGGDPIKARRLYQDFYGFEPSHHFFLAANHRPEIRETARPFGTGSASSPSSRLTRRPPPPITDLDEQLWAEAAGILNWLWRVVVSGKPAASTSGGGSGRRRTYRTRWTC
jgi:putative DNA primase/helicase